MFWERWKNASRSFLRNLDETTGANASVVQQQRELSSIRWDESYHPGYAPAELFENITPKEAEKATCF